LHVGFQWGWIRTAAILIFGANLYLSHMNHLDWSFKTPQVQVKSLTVNNYILSEMSPPEINHAHQAEKILLSALSSVTKRLKMRGLRRLVRWIYDPDKQAKNRFVFTIPYEGLKVELDIAYFIEWNLFFFGEYDPGMPQVIKQFVKPGAVCLDVGAHIGSYTLLMAKEASKVIAVEPLPHLIEKLEANISLNKISNVRILPIVLSDKPELVNLYYPLNHPVGREGSLYRKNVCVENVEKVQLEAKTIDQVMQEENCQRLDFIKIDVEGHEYPILLGGEKSIRKHKPAIIFEYEERTWGNAKFTFQEVDDFFSKLGYSLHLIKPKRIEKIVGKIPEACNILALSY